MIKYYVNETKRTVTAVAENCQFDAILMILKRQPKMAEYLNFIIDKNIEVVDWDDVDEAIDMAYLEALKAYDLKPAVMNEKYTAKAVCHPDDKFDVEEGKRIAGTRLQEKLVCAQKRAVQRWKQKQIALINMV